MNLVNDIERMLDDVDNYTQSLNASLCFIHIFIWDKENNRVYSDVKYFIGKAYQPNDITPDITLLLPNRRGLIVECKRSISRNEDSSRDEWQKIIDQLKKYDDTLTGWDTSGGNVDQQELILLINQKYSKIFVDYLNNKKQTFNKISKNFCVVRYSRDMGRNEAIVFTIEDGEFDDFRELTMDKIKYHITVSLMFLISSKLKKIFFLDEFPPSIYTMSILWDYVFSSMITEEEWRNAKEESDRVRIIEIIVTKKQLRDFITENFCDRNARHSVKESWIEEALDNFIKIKLAKRNRAHGEYTIKYRKNITSESESDNKTEVFARLLCEKNIQLQMDEFLSDE